MKLIFFLLIQNLVFTHSYSCYSQVEPQFERVSNREGLKQNSIFSVIQDRAGFLWMGTANGVFRYDGQKFIDYHRQPGDVNSLPGTSIRNLFEDSNGNIWFSYDEGMGVYLRKKNVFREFQNLNTSMPKNTIVTNIQEISKGQFLVLTNQGLFRFHYSDQINEEVELIPIKLSKSGVRLFQGDKYFSSIVRLDDQWLVASERFLHFIALEENEIVVKKSWDRSLIDKSGVKGMLIGDNSELWVLFSRRLVAVSFEKGVKVLVNKLLPISSHVATACIALDCNNNFWIGTYGEGLLRYNLLSGVCDVFGFDPSDENSLGSNLVFDLSVDRSCILWAATAHGGLSKLDPYKKAFVNVSANYFDKQSLSSNLINGMIIDESGKLWCGTYDAGVNVSKGRFEMDSLKKNSFRSFESGENVNDLISFGHYVILSVGQGVTVYDSRNDQKVELSINHPLRKLEGKNIRTIHKYNEEVWFGMLWGLECIVLDSTDIELQLDQKFNEEFTKTFDDYIVESIFVNKEDLWIGTTRGLFFIQNYQVQPLIYQYRSASDSSSIGSNIVFCIYADRNDKLWFGTYGGGLQQAFYNENGSVERFRRYTTADGLPSNAIYRIEEDTEGFLWLSTDDGISRFNPKEYSFENFNIGDGFSLTNFRKESSVKTPTGEIIFGGLNGLTIFDPSKITKNPIPPRPKITSLTVLHKTIQTDDELEGYKILNKPIHETEEITLPHDLNQVSLGFSSMHYSAIQNHRYQYRLTNVDRDWVTVNGNSTQATYSQLLPGSYLFELKSFNNDGIGGDITTHLTINILPPWWLTGWAYLGYAIILACVVYLTHRYLHYIFSLKKKIATAKRRRLHQREINEAKIKFFINMNHELRTPLTLILSPLERLLHHEKLHPDLKALVTGINQNGERLMSIANSVMDFRKIDRGNYKLNLVDQDLIPFIKKMSEAFVDYAKDKEIVFDVIVSETKLLCSFDPAAIERIIFNLLSNAFKFTPKSGRVELRLYSSNEYILLEIKDTGIGIKEDEIEHIFDRFYKGDHGTTLFDSTGIGLYLVKQLMDMHQGLISVQSKEQEGTVFKIELPLLANDNLLEPTSNSENLEVKESMAREEEQPKILVVEDNLEIRKLVKEVFEGNYRVLEAEDGMIGLKLSINEIPDIIILDVMMPNMDGYELGQKLSDDPRTSHIPLVFLTALSDDDSKRTALERGANLHVTKPFSPYMLELQVKNIFEKRKREAAFIKKNLMMSPDDTVIETKDDVFLKNIKAALEENFQSDQFGIEELAGKLNMSYIQFYRKFKSLTGSNANEYLREFRLTKAAHLLRSDANLMANEVMYMVGFNSQSYFTKSFKKMFKITPANYKTSAKEDVMKNGNPTV